MATDLEQRVLAEHHVDMDRLELERWTTSDQDPDDAIDELIAREHTPFARAAASRMGRPGIHPAGMTYERALEIALGVHDARKAGTLPKYVNVSAELDKYIAGLLTSAGEQLAPVESPSGKIRTLHAQGFNDVAIAEQLGISKYIARQRRLDMGLPPISQDAQRAFTDDAIRELVHQGLSDRAIARQLGCAVSTVAKWRPRLQEAS
jgi:hypothetical protein